MKSQKHTLHSDIQKCDEQLDFGFDPSSIPFDTVLHPTGYTGLAAFHKYWGKKPIECLGFLIENLTKQNEIVVDPFVGSGLIARECAIRNRRFIGIDVNPVSIELACMISDLPSLDQYHTAFKLMEKKVRRLNDQTYTLVDTAIASHYLWDHSLLKEVWLTTKKDKEVRPPTQHDIDLFEQYNNYTSQFIRPLRLFRNARINASETLTLANIFTGRALHNIDLIIHNIPQYPENLRRALFLTLTAAVGQMSNMVFAITARGKNKGESSGRVEVGSWVIGYWLPPLHFEINVWNCFCHRANKLMKALSGLRESYSFKMSKTVNDVIAGMAEIALINANSITALKKLPDASVALVVTDPPHSDRIPYLELSELWNAILAKDTPFQDEIVVSNARDRGKTKDQYNQQMAYVISEIDRILIPGGTLALLFNARDAESWKALARPKETISLQFYGCFPMSYSANSVIQDNRNGAMKSDYVLIYRKTGGKIKNIFLESYIHSIPGWSKDFPKTKG